jgi:hypothetical protein
VEKSLSPFWVKVAFTILGKSCFHHFGEKSLSPFWGKFVFGKHHSGKSCLGKRRGTVLNKCVTIHGSVVKNKTIFPLMSREMLVSIRPTRLGEFSNSTP